MKSAQGLKRQPRPGASHALSGPGKERILLWSSNLWALGEGMLGPLFAVFAQRIGGNISVFSFDALFIIMGTVQVIATLSLAPMLRSSP